VLKEALLYKKKEDEQVECHLCNHYCLITKGAYGICGVRENQGGTLYTHSYGEVIAQNIDPIEKKPLYHFLPGTVSYSIAAAGCNFQCDFCQNWQISQVREAKKLGEHTHTVLPGDVVRQAVLSKSRSISYTYTEPTVFFEYAYDVAQKAKDRGLGNIFVTNGFMTGEMLDKMHPLLDAANIDLKSLNEDYYRSICKGKLKPVLKNIEKMKNLGIWIELTTLVVPGLNDSDVELNAIAGFIARLDKTIPWHISRFYPQYRMDHLDGTPMKTLDRAYEAGKEAGLHYVYVGNVTDKRNHTYCRQCGKCVIERIGFSIRNYKIKDAKCSYCGSAIAGVGL